MIGEQLAKRRIGLVLDGRYELRSLLGVGMTGAVYEALHRYTQRSVALKVMHQQLIGDDTAVARFLREAKAVSSIGHPAIVDVMDAGRTQDRLPYVVLELLRGRSMGALLRERPMSYTETLAAGRDLLDGLAAAHAAGIVHRDLKPDNLFLLDEPIQGIKLKILDFGVAKNLESTGASGIITRPGATIGTPSYMSPEQARAQPIDHRTDLWSAGALLFHAAAHRPPYTDTSIPALLLKLVTKTPPRLNEVNPDVPASLARAVDGALLPNREDRWGSAADMAAALTG
ncbi:MAG: serine/threonine-protein kinase [Sandaracinaceae bacterium]